MSCRDIIVQPKTKEGLLNLRAYLRGCSLLLLHHSKISLAGFPAALQLPPELLNGFRIGSHHSIYVRDVQLLCDIPQEICSGGSSLSSMRLPADCLECPGCSRFLGLHIHSRQQADVQGCKSDVKPLGPQSIVVRHQSSLEGSVVICSTYLHSCDRRGTTMGPALPSLPPPDQSVWKCRGHQDDGHETTCGNPLFKSGELWNGIVLLWHAVALLSNECSVLAHVSGHVCWPTSTPVFGSFHLHKRPPCIADSASFVSLSVLFWPSEKHNVLWNLSCTAPRPCQSCMKGCSHSCQKAWQLPEGL